MEKETIKIMFDFLSGPIWPNYVDSKTLNKITGVAVVDNDEVLKGLNDKASEIYSNYYEFDSHGVACWFNEEQEKKDKYIMLDLIAKIKARLEDLNDGSFEVEDLETERLKNL